MTEQVATYKLAGKSLEAAENIYNYLRENGTDEKSLEKLAKNHPDLCTAIGLNSPHIQVYKYTDMPPRGYYVWPEVYRLEKEPAEFVMACPIDYRGQHFKPEDAVRANVKDADIIWQFAFAGSWICRDPLVAKKRRGAELPKGFKLATANVIDRTNSFSPSHYTLKPFIAAGRSLEVIKDYLRREDEYKKAVNGGITPQKRPSTGDYFQIWNPSAPEEKLRGPHLHSMEGLHYLVYTIDRRAKKDHCFPPDSLPVKRAEYLWLLKNEEDRRLGIIPPPPPASLSHLEPLKPVFRPKF